MLLPIRADASTSNNKALNTTRLCLFKLRLSSSRVVMNGPTARFSTAATTITISNSIIIMMIVMPKTHAIQSYSYPDLDQVLQTISITIPSRRPIWDLLLHFTRWGKTSCTHITCLRRVINDTDFVTPIVSTNKVH